MLHVRVVSPSGLTSRLVQSLAADKGVMNLVVLPAAATRPDGDAVQFDLLTASANAVFQQLQDLGLYRDSSVIIENVDAELADRAQQATRRHPFHSERAPVWALIEAGIRQDAEYAPSFFLLLIFAGLIGACGILTNSQILIVGAMVVGPEYSAIIAVCAGFLAAIVVTLIFALSIRGIGHTPELYLDGVRPVSDLINSPNLFSVVVAVLAGIIGVVSLTSSRTGALIGVFISVTTIPAAADMGVSIAFGSWAEAAGSGEQLLLNVGLLIIVGALALRVQQAIWRNWARRTRAR
jgi:uncharacterized hydrophobic protein (TIGR00271 family)